MVWPHPFMRLFLFFLLGQRIHNLPRSPMRLFHFVFQGVSVWCRTQFFSISCLMKAGITGSVREGCSSPTLSLSLFLTAPLCSSDETKTSVIPSSTFIHHLSILHWSIHHPFTINPFFHSSVTHIHPSIHPSSFFTVGTPLSLSLIKILFLSSFLCRPPLSLSLLLICRHHFLLRDNLPPLDTKHCLGLLFWTLMSVYFISERRQGEGRTPL